MGLFALLSAALSPDAHFIHEQFVRDIPLADIAPAMLGHAKDVAEHVRCWGHCDCRSNIDLLRDLDRIVDLYAKIPHRALDLGVTEQELDSPEIAGSPVDQHCLRASQRVCTEFRWVEADARDPFLDEASILTRGQPALAIIFAAGKEELAWLSPCRSQVVVDRHPRLVCQLESHWPASLLLTDGRAVH
jgi:hypothetical protein